MTLVDTNVILDVVTNDRGWFEWSSGQLDRAAVEGGVAINEIVYAEASVRYATTEAFERMLTKAQFRIVSTPRAALFMAGKVFQRYRAAGGTRTSVLPDFFIGAHAAVAKYRLLSRDTKKLRAYFPTVNLITPYAS